MSTPTPAALLSYADELRVRARAHRGHAHSCDTLLDGVTGLDTGQTWQGTYPDAAHARFQQWVRGLKATAEQLRADATRWERLADQFEGQAGTTPR